MTSIADVLSRFCLKCPPENMWAASDIIARLPDISPPITSPIMNMTTSPHAIPSFLFAPEELLECPKSLTCEYKIILLT